MGRVGFEPSVRSPLLGFMLISYGDYELTLLILETVERLQILSYSLV